MTRINSAIAVETLTDEHLLAEHREIKRMPACLRKSIKSGGIGKIPSAFVLGSGHVNFFLNKQYFLMRRYNKIYQECIRRGFNVVDYSSNWDWIKNEYPQYFNDYKPSKEEKEYLIQRISERIKCSTKTTWHFNKHVINKQDAIAILS